MVTHKVLQELWPVLVHACQTSGMAQRVIPEHVRSAYCYIKNVVLFEENSILLLPECLESSGWQFLKVEVSQESRKNREIGGNRENS